MKRVWVLLIVLMLVLISVAASFLVRFDIHQLTPRLEKDLEWFTGSPVKIGLLALRWKDGLVLEITDLKFLPPGEENSSEEALLSFKKVNARLELFPLLQGKVKIAALICEKPRFQVRRVKSQGVQLEGVDMARVAKRAAAPVKTVGRFLSFSVKAVTLKDGSIRFVNETETGANEVIFEDLNVMLDEIKTSGDMRLAGTASFFSHNPNVKIQTVLNWNPGPHAVIFRDGTVEVSFKALSAKLLEEHFPRIKSVGFQGDLEGDFKAEIREFEVGRQGIGRFDATVGLRGGKFRIPQLANPVENMNGSVSWDPEQIEIQSFTAGLAGGELQMSGRIQQWRTTAEADFEIQAQNLALEDFLPPLSAEEPQLHGRLTGEFRAKSAGRDRLKFVENLQGEGRFFVKDAVYVHRNGLAYALRQLDMFPDLMASVEGKLPQPFKGKLEKTDTVLEPLEQVFVLKGNELTLRDFHFVSESFETTGAITVQIPANVTGQMEIKVAGDMSAALETVYPKLSFFADEHGQIHLPVILEGDVLRVQSHPDKSKIQTILAGKENSKTAAGKSLKPGVSPRTEAKTPFDTKFLDHFIETATSSTKRK